MTDVEHYREEVARVLGVPWADEMVLSFHFDTVDEAKYEIKVIRQKQKELRLIKRNVNADMTATRAAYQEATDKVGSGSGMWGVFFKKGSRSITSAKASEKRGLRGRRDRELQPYDHIKRVIDDVLTQLDGAKLQIEDYIRKESS